MQMGGGEWGYELFLHPPPAVRPRFRGGRLAGGGWSEDVTVVGDAVSVLVALRFSDVLDIEGVDDEAAGAGAAGGAVEVLGPATGVGGWACCGVPFGLSGDGGGADEGGGC